MKTKILPPKLSRWLYVYFFSILSTALLQAQTGLSVHGYLSQAFAFTDGNTLFGIVEEGTFDYRNLALQFRYDTDEYNIFVVQLSHRRSGVNPEMQLEDDISLDWAFFEHRFKNDIVLKAGKIQQPFGIYNELRDVGVLLPFYSAPYAPYGERNYTGETVDGLAISYDYSFSNDWSIQQSLYLGQWDFTEWLLIDNPISGQKILFVEKAQVKNALGVQFWLQPPAEGLRFGLAATYGKLEGGVTFQEGFLPDSFGKERIFNVLLSFDLTKDKYFFRTEYGNFQLLKNQTVVHVFYGQFGYNLFANLSLNIQSSFYHIRNLDNQFSRFSERDLLIDHAFGINYKLTQNIVLKAETHFNKSYFAENVSFNLDAPAPETMYTIISLSSSF